MDKMERLAKIMFQEDEYRYEEGKELIYYTKEDFEKGREEREMTEEQKRNLYESYLGEYYYEWGKEDGAMTYEEFCEDCEEYGWEMI